MQPYIYLFGTRLDSINVMWALGILFMQVYYQLMCRKYKLRWHQALLSGVIFLLTEVLGAKLLYIAENLQTVLKGGLSFGGFSFFGILFTLPLGAYIASKLFCKKYSDVLDYLAPGVLIELSFYRIGCMLAGCCHGFEWYLGIKGIGDKLYFPTQPIEAVLDLAIAFVLIWCILKNKMKSGYIYLTFLLSYGYLRFILEFTRERTRVLGPLSVSHLLCLFWITVATLTVLSLEKKDTPTALTDQSPTDRTAKKKKQNQK